jgi:hypothetical protein
MWRGHFVEGDGIGDSIWPEGNHQHSDFNEAGSAVFLNDDLSRQPYWDQVKEIPPSIWQSHYPLTGVWPADRGTPAVRRSPAPRVRYGPVPEGLKTPSLAGHRQIACGPYRRQAYIAGRSAIVRDTEPSPHCGRPLMRSLAASPLKFAAAVPPRLVMTKHDRRCRVALSPERGIAIGEHGGRRAVLNETSVIDRRRPVPEFERATRPARVSQYSA